MMKLICKVILLLMLFIFLVSCANPEVTSEPENTLVPEIISTSGVSPAIEILAGPADSCQNTDDTQSTLVDFEVDYFNVGSDSFMVGILSAPEVGVIGGAETPGEGHEGLADWGIYPEEYDLPSNTSITLDIFVHTGEDETARVSSFSSITFDCTTGETISVVFEN